MSALLRLLLLLILTTIRDSVNYCEYASEYCECAVDSCSDNAISFTYIYAGNSSEECTCINIDSSDPVLLVGDSRTVGLYLSTHCDDISYLAKGSMGYSWLVSGTSEYDPEQLICNYLTANPEGKVVFNLGVNDIYNQSKYVTWLTQFSEQHPYAQLYYLSVNPAKGRSDLDITGFNSCIQSNLPENVTWLDSCTYLEETGFYAGDGVHYDVDTYYRILDFILANVEEVCYE